MAVSAYIQNVLVDRVPFWSAKEYSLPVLHPQQTCVNKYALRAAAVNSWLIYTVCALIASALDIVAVRFDKQNRG